MSNLHIAIEPFKRNEYDRGSKKILVNGEEWGWIEMQAHGCHGPSYHAHDMHGPVFSDKRTIARRAGEEIEARFKPQGGRSVRLGNIGKPESERVKPKSTEDQLREHVADLIAKGHLRAPAVRAAEIKASNDEWKAQREAQQRSETEALVVRARDIIMQMQRGACGEHLVNEIIAAMRWAQTQ